MDENAGKSPDEGENAENKPAPSAASETPSESKANNSKLPVVWSPTLSADRGDQRGPSRVCRRGRRHRPRTQRTTKRANRPASRPTAHRCRARCVLRCWPPRLRRQPRLAPLPGRSPPSGVAHFWPRPRAPRWPRLAARRRSRPNSPNLSALKGKPRRLPRAAPAANSPSLPNVSTVRAGAGGAGGEARPHRRSDRPAGEEKRDGVGGHRCAGHDRLVAASPQLSSGRRQIAGKCFAGLDRAGRARRPGAGAKSLWWHFRYRRRQHPSRVSARSKPSSGRTTNGSSSPRTGSFTQHRDARTPSARPREGGDPASCHKSRLLLLDSRFRGNERISERRSSGARFRANLPTPKHMIRKMPAPDLIRGGRRFSDKIMCH